MAADECYPYADLRIRDSYADLPIMRSPGQDCSLGRPGTIDGLRIIRSQVLEEFQQRGLRHRLPRQAAHREHAGELLERLPQLPLPFHPCR